MIGETARLAASASEKTATICVASRAVLSQQQFFTVPTYAITTAGFYAACVSHSNKPTLFLSTFLRSALQPAGSRVMA